LRRQQKEIDYIRLHRSQRKFKTLKSIYKVQGVPRGNRNQKNDDVCCGLSTALIILWSVGLALLLVNMALAAVLLYKYEDCDTDPEEPPIPGAMPGSSKPTIILAMDTNYPPYAETAPPADGL